MDPFYPADHATVNIDVASSSANVLVASNPEGRQIRIFNNGSATAWVRFGADSALAAAIASDMPVGPGVTEVITLQSGPIYAAAIAAGSTGKIYFTKGTGY